MCSFPSILTDTYVDWAALTTYNAYMTSDGNFTIIGNVLSSIAMGEDARWGGAVVDFHKRGAYDVQMMLGWGHDFDYTHDDEFHIDIYGFGGTGNGWMRDMWNAIT